MSQPQPPSPPAFPTFPAFPKGLPLYSAFVAASVVFLICIGALVTSFNAGMSVPDWPTSYGYNMFTFPIQKWIGPIFYEHTHRLVASVVGLFTVILAGWVWLKEPRPWVRKLAVFAVALVILQGVVGGIRVIKAQQDYGIVHGTLAQLFLVTTGLLALVYSRNWRVLPSNGARLPKGWEQGIAFVSALIFCQLILGAVMRHQHAGLSIPDFPTVYGHVVPHVTEADLVRINAHRQQAGQVPTSLVQIYLQVAHRAMALVILSGIIAATLAIFRCRQSPPHLRFLSGIWTGLVCLQVALGMTVIWSQKNPFITSLHVVTGALLLLVGSHLTFLIIHWRRMEKLR
ncbi:cytochrome c oxidase assembly protein subunit 15 [Verrucomicrobium sp. GAS474]|uniref:COX15/CtaA family protein n=1 Tax=Verrucomicrobium sp. GAS474 TaxID=1882831 RepID=UPI00087B21BA|nr:COX15/CtaA family protein [Verrucomicrobium sp. GAS474]SDU17289.1 cytochrome c oxidase assembly protein subunit 15 [Verrucomicrobium sp. GAS474]